MVLDVVCVWKGQVIKMTIDRIHVPPSEFEKAMVFNLAEISYVLDLLVELDEIFADAAKGKSNVYSIIEGFKTLDPNDLDEDTRDTVKLILALANRDDYIDTFKNMEVVDHSWIGNPEFDNMHVAAAVFEDKNGNVFLAMRGTGKGRWVDNGTMMFLDESEMQKETLMYLDKVIFEKFNDGDSIRGGLFPSGHSKGGNDAQYFTMFSKYRDLVTYSFNYNGPGSSNEAMAKFEASCIDRAEELGMPTEEYMNSIHNKMYGIVGEDDYVFFRGRNIPTPKENIFFVTTFGTGIMDYHYAHKMASENGINWQRNEYGRITNGKPGPLGELSILVHELEILMDDDMYRPSSISLLSLLESGIGGGIGAGNIKFASAADFKYFLEKGLPFLLNGTDEVKGLKHHPELMKAVCEMLFSDSTFKIHPDVLLSVAEVLSNVSSYIPENVIESFIQGHVETFNTGDTTAQLYFGTGALFSTLPPAIGISLNKHAFTWVLDEVRQQVQNAIDSITAVANMDIALRGSIANKLFDAAGGLLENGMRMISALSSANTQFSLNFLRLAKNAHNEYIPGLPHVYDFFEGIVRNIDLAVQASAETSKNIMQSVNDTLKDTVDTILSGSRNAVNALGDFLTGMVGMQLNAQQEFVRAAHDTIGKNWKMMSEFAWDAGTFAVDSLAIAGKAAREVYEYVNEALLTAGLIAVDKMKTVTKEYAINSIAMLSQIDLLSMILAPLTPRLAFRRLSQPQATSSFSGALGSGARVALSLDQLERLQRSIADLVNIWQGTFGVVQESYSIANAASRDYKQANVQTAANSVRSACNSIDTMQNSVYWELVKINEGLIKAINGYRSLEVSLV